MKDNPNPKLRTTLKSFSAGIAVTALLLFSCVCLADGFKPDMQGIVHDTQKMSNADHQLTLVWWIPKQYWQVSFESNKRVTPEAAADFLRTVKPYTVLAVVKGKIGSFGAVTYEDEATLRSELVLVDGDGNKYSPLDDSEISPDMKNFIGIMKPMFANMMGSMGKNIDFYLFPATGKNGQMIADAEKEGRFSVRVGNDEYKWRLPVGSVLPPKTCPKCGEELSGAFKFCPYDGSPLGK